MKADTLATSIEEAGPLGPSAARDSGKVSRDLAPAGLHGLLPAIADIGLLRCRGCDAQSPTIACEYTSISAVADGPARRAASGALCCIQK